MKVALSLIVLIMTPVCAQNEREEKIKHDKETFEKKKDWLYNDLTAAYQQAKASNKPIMAVLRCIPCEECVKLDDDVIDNDRAIAPLMDQFIRVRLTGTNGLDLKTFQYDTDQSFAIFFLNADRVVYGRFGTRSHRTEWITDVSVEGMARAMQAALRLHEGYPANRAQLLAKSNRPTEYSTPEQFPTLSRKPGRLNWQGRGFATTVAKNCIHCHEISEARMEHYWRQQKEIPEEVMSPYPHPKSIGLILDPDFAARVEKVTPDTPAAEAGLRPGDEISSMDGQPLISMADVQWVLHHTPAKGARIPVELKRGGRSQKLTLPLNAGWRKADDTTWRTGHWILRRSMLGGMKLESGPSERSAIRVQYAGTWGPFGAAHRAGARKGDEIISIDGKTGFRRESEVFDYINQNKQSGQSISMTLKRGTRQMKIQYQIQ